VTARIDLQQQVAELLPERRGHFVFESGHHGQDWLDLERLFLHPERVEPLAAALVSDPAGNNVEAVHKER